jgi:RNA polymerase sigma factor (sigma-70 family)
MVGFGGKGTTMSGRRKQRQPRSGRGRPGSTQWTGPYAEHHPQIRSWFAARVASAQDADDLAEEVFAQLARGDPSDDLKAYIAVAARNALARYRRRRARERDFLQRLLEVTARADEMRADEPRDPSEEGESSAELGPVEKVLRTLPRAQAQLLRLRFLKGLPMAEVARRAGCSREVAYKRLQRIIKRLRDRYAGEPPTLRDGKDPKSS